MLEKSEERLQEKENEYIHRKPKREKEKEWQIQIKTAINEEKHSYKEVSNIDEMPLIVGKVKDKEDIEAEITDGMESDGTEDGEIKENKAGREHKRKKKTNEQKQNKETIQHEEELNEQIRKE